MDALIRAQGQKRKFSRFTFLPSLMLTHRCLAIFPPLHFPTISYHILSALQNLNSNKTPGPVELHRRILKECVNELASSLCILLNKSLRLGKRPTDWKQANIVPIFKKGTKASISNYRQVSLLSTVTKLCERCVLKKLLHGLIHLLTGVQHGFVRGRSCVTQLLSVLHDLDAMTSSLGVSIFCMS